MFSIDTITKVSEAVAGKEKYELEKQKKTKNNGSILKFSKISVLMQWWKEILISTDLFSAIGIPLVA